MSSIQNICIIVQVFLPGNCAEPGGRPNTTRFGAVGPYHAGDQVVYACAREYMGGGATWCVADGTWTSLSDCSLHEHGVFY